MTEVGGNFSPPDKKRKAGELFLRWGGVVGWGRHSSEAVLTAGAHIGQAGGRRHLMAEGLSRGEGERERERERERDGRLGDPLRALSCRWGAHRGDHTHTHTHTHTHNRHKYT